MKNKLIAFILAVVASQVVWSQALNKNIEPPKLVWKKFIQFALKGDVNEAANLAGGEFRKKILKGSPDDQKKFLKEKSGEFENNPGKVNELISQGVNGLQATVLFKPDKGITEIEIKFMFNRNENRWLIISCGKVAGTENPSAASNIKRLKQIAIACWFYSDKNNGKFPENLSTLKERKLIMEQETLSWINPKSGEEKPFIYCQGLSQSDSEKTILAAEPEAVDDKREVLFCDGNVSEITENAFQIQAKKQKWEVKSATAPE